jgi:hypothetical protein
LRCVKKLTAAPWVLVCVVGLCLAAGTLAYLAASGAGSDASASTEAVTTAGPATFRAALISRLRAQRLNFHWVVCVRTPHRFQGVRVVRCNVDFGIDPHVEAYCSVLRGGRLLTSEQDAAIPCGRDNAGFSDPVVTYG